MSISSDIATAIVPPARPAAISAPRPDIQHPKESFWGEDGFTFGDLIDLVNPLQHIPVVSTVYRAITGDTQSTGAKVLGGGLFGGVVGLLASFVDASTETTPGQGIGERTIAALLPGDRPADVAQPATEFAANGTAVKDTVQTVELPETLPSVPELAELPASLPGDPISAVKRAEIEAAIQKYLRATAKIQEDAADDRRAALAADLLL